MHGQVRSVMQAAITHFPEWRRRLDMPIDPSISLNARAPDTMAKLSSLMSVAGAAQDLKRAKATFDYDVAQRGAESRASKASADVAEANVQPLIAQQAASTAGAQTAAKHAAWNLQDAQHQKTIDTVTGLIGDESVRKGDPAGIDAALTAAADNAVRYGADPKDIEASIIPLRQLAKSNPGAVQPALINLLRQGLGASGQAQVIQPSGPQINTGQVQYQANTNPLAATPQGAPVPGTGAVNQIPVGTQGFDPNTQAPYVSGPGGGMQAGPALGQQTAVEGVSDAVNKDWQATSAAGAAAAQNIGILQNIKGLADTAATGAFADRRAFANKLGALIGMDAAELAATDTDVLAKNASMLALAGGNTDAARALAEMANPNVKMTTPAIKHAADQIIGQQKLALAKQQFMQRYAGNPQQYSQQLGQFNQVADPRTFEFAAKTPEERKEMLGTMTPAEKADLKAKMEALHNLGINP
jgi:hypothetical protein